VAWFGEVCALMGFSWCLSCLFYLFVLFWSSDLFVWYAVLVFLRLCFWFAWAMDGCWWGGFSVNLGVVCGDGFFFLFFFWG